MAILDSKVINFTPRIKPRFYNQNKMNTIILNIYLTALIVTLMMLVIFVMPELQDWLRKRDEKNKTTEDEK